MNRETITEYYDYTVPFYRIFYHGESSAIHYGFWEGDVKNHMEALLNVNRFMAEKARIKADDNVLDAGCGIGGSTVWLASRIGAKGTGITISERQLRKARSLASRKGVEHLVNFEKRDYLHTGFDEGSFTVVWAIESVCHAEDKRDFLREARRLLRDGGRLVVSDGFLLRQPATKRERRDLDAFLEGMALSGLAAEPDFRQALEEVGFRNIQVYDMAAATLPSSRKIRRMSLFSYPLSVVLQRLGLTPPLLTRNNLAGLTQYRIIKKGIMGHRVFCAEK